MAVLLLLLKIFGILILVVLGLLVLGCVSVLFLPVRYKAEINLYEKNEFQGENQIMEELKNGFFRFKISWLFRLIGILVEYKEQKSSYQVRILGFKIHHLRTLQRSESVHVDGVSDSDCESIKDSVSISNEESSDMDNNQERSSIAHRKKGSKFKDVFSMLSGAFLFAKNEENGEALRLILRELKDLCKHYGPRKARGEIRFGLSEPNHTGILVGILSIMPCVYQRGFYLRPDFQSEKIYVHGDVTIKGHIRGIHLLKSTVVLMKNKTLRDLIKKKKTRE